MRSNAPSSTPAGTFRTAGRLGPAVVLLISESAWLTLAVDAFANGTAGSHRPRLDLPYLALVLPGLVALVVVSMGRGPMRAARRSMPRRWARRAVVGVAVIAGCALSAGIIAELSAPGTVWTAAFHPWSLAAHAVIGQRATRWGWAVAVLMWARGTWLAVSPPGLGHSTASLLVGAFVFVVVFGHEAASGPGPFERATGAAGWLLFVYFPTGVTAAAWAHERQVERRALRRTGHAPGGAWLAALVAPFALVALVAFLVGGAGTVVGPAAAAALHAFGVVLGAIGDWIFNHLPRIVVHPGHLRARTFGRTSSRQLHRRTATSSHPSALGIALLCVLGVIVLGVVVFGVRAIVRWARRRQPELEVDEERESVFTWGHLAGQLRRALLGLMARIRRILRPRRAPVAHVPVQADLRDGPEGDPVRAAYRRLLSAARDSGNGRAPEETPRELGARLASSSELDQVGAIGLRSLTTVYELVRYADTTSARFAGRAAEDADVVARQLVAARERDPRVE